MLPNWQEMEREKRLGNEPRFSTHDRQPALYDELKFFAQLNHGVS